MTNTKAAAATTTGTAPIQKLVVVDGGLEVLGDLEAVLQASRYDMVFARSSDLAYSQIKKTHPNLVILCGNIQDLDGSRLLTMLKLDPDTRGIPLISYAAPEWEDPDRAASEPADDDDAPPRGPGLRMN